MLACLLYRAAHLFKRLAVPLQQDEGVPVKALRSPEVVSLVGAYGPRERIYEETLRQIKGESRQE